MIWGDEHNEKSYESMLSITFPVSRKGKDQSL